MVKIVWICRSVSFNSSGDVCHHKHRTYDLHDATLMTDTVQLFLAGECRDHEKERIISSAVRDGDSTRAVGLPTAAALPHCGGVSWALVASTPYSRRW
jgi:hypothetical protein